MPQVAGGVRGVGGVSSHLSCPSPLHPALPPSSPSLQTWPYFPLPLQIDSLSSLSTIPILVPHWPSTLLPASPRPATPRPTSPLSALSCLSHSPPPALSPPRLVPPYHLSPRTNTPCPDTTLRPVLSWHTTRPSHSPPRPALLRPATQLTTHFPCHGILYPILLVTYHLPLRQCSVPC